MAAKQFNNSILTEKVKYDIVIGNGESWKEVSVGNRDRRAADVAGEIEEYYLTIGSVGWSKVSGDMYWTLGRSVIFISRLRRVD